MMKDMTQLLSAGIAVKLSATIYSEAASALQTVLTKASFSPSRVAPSEVSATCLEAYSILTEAGVIMPYVCDEPSMRKMISMLVHVHLDAQIPEGTDEEYM